MIKLNTCFNIHIFNTCFTFFLFLNNHQKNVPMLCFHYVEWGNDAVLVFGGGDMVESFPLNL